MSYADDLVIFSSKMSLNLAINNFNSALKDLSNILTKISFNKNANQPPGVDT